MTDVPEILEGIQLLFSSTPDLVAAIPGGLHYEGASGAGAPATTQGTTIATPYATIKVKPLKPNRNSSRTYWQQFDLTFRVWTVGGGTIDAASVKESLDAVFNQDGVKANLTVSGADRVIDFVPLEGGMDLDATRKNAEDVLVTSRHWELWLQITR